MNQNPSGQLPRSRSNRAQRLYAAREIGPADEIETISYTNDTDVSAGYMPIETPHAAAQPDVYANGDYTPNEPDEQAYNQPAYAPQEVDYSAYYRPDSQPAEGESEPTFAPPIKLDEIYSYAQPEWPEEPLAYEDEAAQQGNVYRPREVTWAQTGRMQAMQEQNVAYQVHAEEKAPRRRRRRPLRNALIVLLVLVLAAAAVWLLQAPIKRLLAGDTPTQTQQPFETVTTPQPVKAYDASPAFAIADGTRAAISQISGSVSMEPYAVTDTHVLTRNQRKDGSYDFYLFTAEEGRLLAYFEGLGALDMLPQENGVFYVKQKPWLVAPSGSALIRTAEMEQTFGESLVLHPLMNGWALLETQETGARNYINVSGQLINRLWFSRAFPFTGDYTAAYADTGVTADPEQRYLLYVLGADGTMSRWQAAADMQALVASACGMAYMNGGELYRLPDTSAPLWVTDQVDAYLDCSALVVRDPESGKYGLFVQGEQHYDFAYDRIAPVQSDIRWGEKTLTGSGGSFTVHAVEGAAYPQPLSHSFVLEKDGQSEYVALSTTSVYPIRLDGEF